MQLEVFEISERLVKVAAHQVGHQPVGAQQSVQQRSGKEGDFLRLTFDEQLSENDPRDVFLRLAVADLDRLAVANELLDPFQRDILASRPRVKPTIGVTVDVNHGNIQVAPAARCGVALDAARACLVAVVYDAAVPGAKMGVHRSSANAALKVRERN